MAWKLDIWPMSVRWAKWGRGAEGWGAEGVGEGVRGLRMGSEVDFQAFILSD